MFLSVAVIAQCSLFDLNVELMTQSTPSEVSEPSRMTISEESTTTTHRPTVRTFPMCLADLNTFERSNRKTFGDVILSCIHRNCRKIWKREKIIFELSRLLLLRLSSCYLLHGPAFVCCAAKLVCEVLRSRTRACCKVGCKRAAELV